MNLNNGINETDFTEDINVEELDVLAKDINYSFDNNIIKLYLKEIGEYPLLNKDEEVNLSTIIKNGNEILNIVNIQDSDIPFDVINQMVSDMEEAKDKIINSNLKLVVSIAKKFSWSNLPLDELIQEGNMGLMVSVDKFDVSKGFRFSTYATFWIRQSIQRAIQTKSKDIRLPSKIQEQMSSIFKVETELTNKLKRKATNEEISLETGLSVGKIEELKSYHFTFKSLDGLVSSSVDITLQETISDTSNENPLENAITLANKELIEEAVSKLGDVNKDVIAMSFGLFGYEIHTLDKIATKFNVSIERIRQRRTSSLQVLRKYLVNKI